MGRGGSQICICIDALLVKRMEQSGLNRNKTFDRLHIPFCCINILNFFTPSTV